MLGFNCFTKEVAECNIRAPEHSDAFNRTIKLYQAMSAMGLPITIGNSNSNSNSIDCDERITSSGGNDDRQGNRETRVHMTQFTTASNDGNNGVIVTDNSNSTIIKSINSSDCCSSIAATSWKVDATTSEKGINARDVMRNPALKRMLLMAARKIKENESKQIVDRTT